MWKTERWIKILLSKSEACFFLSTSIICMEIFTSRIIMLYQPSQRSIEAAWIFSWSISLYKTARSTVDVPTVILHRVNLRWRSRKTRSLISWLGSSSPSFKKGTTWTTYSAVTSTWSVLDCEATMTSTLASTLSPSSKLMNKTNVKRQNFLIEKYMAQTDSYIDKNRSKLKD